MKYLLDFTIILLIAWSVLGCTPKADIETHRQKLIELNEKMRIAHLEGDAEAILSAQDYPYVKVNSGRVTHPTKEDNEKRFHDYLGNMNIIAWDDLIDPIIVMSDDASLATVIYKKRLVMAPKANPDAESFEGIFAWQSTYRRTNEGWKQISDILTVLPEEG